MKIENIKSAISADKQVNTRVVDLINEYKIHFKSGVISCINIGKVIHKAENLTENKEISEADIKDFCLGIGLLRSSSQYRKYRAIGAYADVLEQLHAKLPSATSTLYQITQFSKDKILELVETKSIDSNTTLNQVKTLQGTGKQVTENDKETMKFSVNFQKRKLSGDIQLIIEKKLNDMMRDVLADIYNNLVDQGIKNITVLINEQHAMSSNSNGELVKSL